MDDEILDHKPHPMAWVTYFLYMVLVLAWYVLIMAGCTYLVFWKDHSGAWYLLAIILCGSPIRPTEWVFGVPPHEEVE